GLLGQQEKMPASLSGGMIKRVAVARAIITTPECLLYDEPTGGLDPIVRDSISFLIRQICKDKGITTVIVSHDMPSVIRIADKIVYLRNGEVYWTGTPEELLHSKDEILQKFLYGDSGENWAALSGKNENFQRVLLERAERERKQ
ncbi:ATP-binding cassette domain-containing protein, partial [Escherichia coli]|nr:ATP-binding cassette domain-containing protein [Escherichia coli]